MVINRREFATRLAGAGIILGAPTASFAQEGPPTSATIKPGVHYLELIQRQPTTSTPSRTEVVVFFSYLCVHCRNFNAELESWAAKQGNIEFKQVPVGFSQETMVLQNLFFSLQAMGLDKQMHAKIYKAIWDDKRQLFAPGMMDRWVQEQGINKKQLADLSTSEGIMNKQMLANSLMRGYQVRATPSFGVAGKYMVPHQGTFGLRVLEHLIKSETTSSKS